MTEMATRSDVVKSTRRIKLVLGIVIGVALFSQVAFICFLIWLLYPHL